MELANTFKTSQTEREGERERERETERERDRERQRDDVATAERPPQQVAVAPSGARPQTRTIMRCIIIIIIIIITVVVVVVELLLLVNTAREGVRRDM